jgi:LEA14-like dessication related protein
MKNKIKHISLFVLALAIITGGIIFIFRKPIIMHFMPVVEQIGDIHIKVKNDTSYVSSILTVENKSFLKIEIDTLKYKVSLFDKTYLQSQRFIGMVLQGYGKDTIDFSIKIPYVTILKDIKTERKKGDSASYSINIFLQYSTVLGKAEIPINKSAKLKIPQPPELKIEEIKWERIRLKSIRANAKIKITNYSSIILKIKNLNYSMKILKQGNLKGSYREPINIKSNGTTFIDLPIEINVNNIGKTVFEILINKDTYDYTLTLNAILESSDPLKKSFQVDLIKSGKIELKK